MWSELRWFKKNEFQCPCCGTTKMYKPFLNLLDKARQYANVPFRITSGYRCVNHNSHCGGIDTSLHLAGRACDIHVVDSSWRASAVGALLGFSGVTIGIYSAKTHIHVHYQQNKNNIMYVK